MHPYWFILSYYYYYYYWFVVLLLYTCLVFVLVDQNINGQQDSTLPG